MRVNCGSSVNIDGTTPPKLSPTALRYASCVTSTNRSTEGLSSVFRYVWLLYHGASTIVSRYAYQVF